MSRYSSYGKVAKNGAVDSKYFGNADKFEEDVRTKIENTNKFKKKVREIIIENPSLIEQRYFDVIEVLKEIKKEFEI